LFVPSSSSPLQPKIRTTTTTTTHIGRVSPQRLSPSSHTNSEKVRFSSGFAVPW
jgi:hypothetical protein